MEEEENMFEYQPDIFKNSVKPYQKRPGLWFGMFLLNKIILAMNLGLKPI